MKIDARGKQCPLPVIEAKEALRAAAPGEVVALIALLAVGAVATIPRARRRIRP